MESFATAQQMQQRTKGAITATTHPSLTSELAAATRAIRDACGWHVATLEPLVHRRSGPFARDIWLPAMQIDSIAEAVVDGADVDLTQVRFDPDTGWTNLRGASCAITYAAGFEEVPESLVSLTLQIAARALSSPTGVTREQIGQHSVSFALTSAQASGGIVLLDVELEQLTPYILGTLP